jgi:hypothetical protein
MKKKKKNDLDQIEMEIDDAQNKASDEDEDIIVPPKVEIFKDSGTPKEEGVGYTATFHGTDSEDADENVKIDETYKSSVQADHQFMITFGLSANQPSVVSEKDPATSKEAEILQSDTSSDYYEYNDRLQRKQIGDMYKYAKRNIKTKAIFVAIFTILLFFFENVNLFIKNPTGFLANPYVLITVNLVLLLLCGAFAHEQIYHGIRSIFNKNYLPESVAVVAALCSIIHTLIMFIAVIFKTEAFTLTLFNFPVAFIIFLLILYSYINVVREKYGFSVVCARDAKFYLEKMEAIDAEAENETFSGTAGEFNGEIARVKRTGFVKNYFANTNIEPNLHSYLGVYFILSLLIPAVFAIISLFVKNFDFFQAFTVWYVGVLLMLPVGILFSYSVPFLIGNKRLYSDDVAIIGENGITDFSNIDVVSVNDTTAFPPKNVKLTNFQVYNGFKTEKDLYYAASGFALVGGPLSAVFDASTKDAIPKSRKVKFVCSGRSYLCIKIDNDTIIYADKYGMSAQGIDVGAEKEEEEKSSIMYMACNGVLCSKMNFIYEMDEEFIKIASFLNRNSVGVGIRTFDPNINIELVKDKTKEEKAEIKIIRLSSEEEAPTISARNDAKIVSKGLSKSLLKAIPVCKKIVTSRKATGALKIISSILGAAMLGLSIFGKLALATSAIITGYYIALTILMLVTTLIIMPTLD